MENARNAIKIFLLLIPLGLAGCQCGPEAKFAKAERIVLDPKSSEAEAINAFSVLRQPNYNSTIAFWRKIIDDSRFTPTRRNRAFMLLIVRHLPPGATLAQASALFSGSPWTHQKDAVQVLDPMTSWPPVPFNAEFGGSDRIVVLKPFEPRDGPRRFIFYLQVDPSVSTPEFMESISTPTSTKFADHKIVAWGIAVADPRDEALCNGTPVSLAPPEEKRTLLDIELDK